MDVSFFITQEVFAKVKYNISNSLDLYGIILLDVSSHSFLSIYGIWFPYCKTRFVSFKYFLIIPQFPFIYSQYCQGREEEEPSAANEDNR